MEIFLLIVITLILLFMMHDLMRVVQLLENQKKEYEKRARGT